jgi:hypothetical protein
MIERVEAKSYREKPRGGPGDLTIRERLEGGVRRAKRRSPVGANPTQQPLQPEATGAAMEVTKWLKPSVSVSRYTVTARVCRP